MWTSDSDPTLEFRSTLHLEAIAGRSAALVELFRRIRNVASLDGLHVLLTGATGTGKSLVARVLHENGPRADKPFVEVNCAAIPRDLWEAEFFGSTRNAYTQAAERRGRSASADGGTLFLDEVGELATDLQAKLLRVLDRGCYERLGEDRTRSANVRIIAATNRPLEQDMADGRFRSDLFFRLSRYQIRVPSLAERREDIAELATLFAERECKSLGLASIPVASALRSALAGFEWPGNIRQLQSVMTQAVIEAASCGASEIGWEHLGAEHLAQLPGFAAAAVCADPASPADAPPRLADQTRDFQRRVVIAALATENGNAARAARRLGVARSHFYTLLGGSRSACPRAATKAR